MMDQKFLFELLQTSSVGGSEAAWEKKIYDYMQGKADTVTVDEAGSVTATLCPEADFRVLLAGHADEIGLMVTMADSDGMLRVTNIGGIYPHCFPGQKVRVYTKNGVIYGAVMNSRDISGKEKLEAADLKIDIGAKSREEALRAVRVGDTVTVDTDVRELLNGRITARAMDDRIGAFIVMEALCKARAQGVKVGAYAAATVGEETTSHGAYLAASRVRPRIAIAVDVTYATDYDAAKPAESGEVKLDGGPVLCICPSVNRQVTALLEEAAQSAGITVQYEVAGGRTYTDGDVMRNTGIGVPMALVSIPLRYMHSPAEVGSLADIQACIDLLAAFLCRCTGEENLKPF